MDREALGVSIALIGVVLVGYSAFRLAEQPEAEELLIGGGLIIGGAVISGHLNAGDLVRPIKKVFA